MWRRTLRGGLNEWVESDEVFLVTRSGYWSDKVGSQTRLLSFASQLCELFAKHATENLQSSCKK
jgi:hypothetical protein